MSFVDLMGNDVWSEADIVRRTEAMVRSEFSAEAEAILNRKVNAAAFGSPLSTDDEAELARFQAVVLAAQAAGDEARADMARLSAVLEHAAARSRLALPAADGDAEDAAERGAAQARVDGASAETLDLYALRHPQPEPDLEPEVEA